MELIIVTGLSGAGKSQAVHCLEDMGYYCVDNMPPGLMPAFINLAENSSPQLGKIAFVADVRSGQFFNDFKRNVEFLEQKGLPVRIMFLEAADATLIKRFKETRRTHPLSAGGSLENGIREEREKLASIREKASFIIDTSNLKNSQLRSEIKALLADGGKNEDSFIITVESFGYKNGLPQEADWILDVRFLPNPYYEQRLKHLTGNNAKIVEYILRSDEAVPFLDSCAETISGLIPSYEREGKSQLTVALGCTGGRHRSVAMCNLLAERLRKNGHHVISIHRDL